MTLKTLYHGSVFKFTSIDVDKGKGYKDFGKGFYTTEIKSHAERLAKRNCLIEKARRKSLNIKDTNVVAYLYKYEFDTSLLERYNSKIFTEADVEWVNFVLENRASANKIHDYDIIKGPTADDDTKLTFNAYRSGAYGDFQSDKAISTLIRFLEVDNLPMQLYFGTNKVVKELKLKGVNIIL